MDQQDTIRLPEINVSNKEDWDFLTPIDSTPPPTPPHLYEPTHQLEQSDSEESITTGLTRTLSLPRQSPMTMTEKEEDIRKEVINISTSNPSHLFWVPASQHPEIAPAEFEKYVDAHGLMIRKKSVRRRQSVLSVYFTASDQQKLFDEIANTDSQEQDIQATLEALESSSNRTSMEGEDGRQNKMILRRSVSLQLPSAGDYARNVPDLLVFDRNSSPLDESRALVPKGDRPLLRRGARTNFKRNSSVTARSSLTSKSDEESTKPSIVSTDNPLTDEPSALSPVVETEEVRELCVATRSQEDPPANSPPQPVVMTRSVSTSTSNPSSNRKSTWSWAFWSDEKNKKHNKIDPGTTSTTAEATESTQELPKSMDHSSSSNKRFTLSSLFSRKSKNNQSVYTTSNMDLLSSSGSLTKAPKDFQLNSMYMTRLPLHVERAIYKLSHIKLANPRRPLHEQVLISNQMFWYLSVIASNNPQSQSPAADVEERKKPRKRLVKKHQRPASAPPSSKKKQTTFMANKAASRTESTGFVVPDNYLNPKRQPQQHNKTAGSSMYGRHDWDHHNGRHIIQSSDSSSDEDEEDEALEGDADKCSKQRKQKEDDIPLAMYKAHHHQKIK